MTPEEMEKECARMTIQNRSARLAEITRIRPHAARDVELQAYYRQLSAAYGIARPKVRTARRRRREDPPEAQEAQSESTRNA